MTVLASPKTPYRGDRLAQFFAFDGPASAIVLREVGRFVQERIFRLFVIGLTATNVAIAFSLNLGPSGSGTSNIESFVRESILYQGLMLCAIGFIFTAARAGMCIGTERARDTWEMMWMTPAQPMAIAIGHIVAAMAPATLLTLSQLPVLAPFVYALGADEWPRLAAATAVGLTSWVACAAWAFWASAQFRNFGQALAGAFVAAFWASGLATAMLVGTIILFSSWASPTGNPSFYAADALKISSPAMQLYYIVFTGRLMSPVASHIVFMLLSSLIPLVMGARAIRREREVVLGGTRATLRQMFASTSPSNRSIEQFEIPDGKNPIYAIERHIAAVGRRRAGIILFLLFSCFALLASFEASPESSRDEAKGGIAALFFIALGVAAYATASGTVDSEEHQTFEMVAMTGLHAREIQLGKIQSGLSRMLPIVALLFTCTVIVISIIGELLLGFACLLTFILSVASLLSSGLFTSAASRGNREAIGANMVLGIAMFFGVPILSVSLYVGIVEAASQNVFGIHRWFAQSVISQDTYDFLASGSSPITGLLQLLDNPESRRAWLSWGLGCAVCVAWTVLWYNVAGRLLQRRLEGRLGWVLGTHAKE